MACDPQQVPFHRYVKTENIRAGDIILEEEPWMWSLLCFKGVFEKGELARTVCHYCLLSPGKLLACSACKSAWYCGPACQRADWDLRHKHGDCRMQQEISQLSTGAAFGDNGVSLFPHELSLIIRRLLLSSASARLFSAKDRSVSSLWQAVLNAPSKTDGWVDVDRIKRPASMASATYNKLVRTITWKELPDNLIEKRILPSLVAMIDYAGWKKMVQSTEVSSLSQVLIWPKDLALGACLEMSKFPNNCNPNAIVISEGRLVRMIALEDIPNLDAVRPTRTRVWFEARFYRRTEDVYNRFGFDCGCTRCCAGDSAETAMYALRCPTWAARYKFTDGTTSGCDGMVTGLRRSDVEEDSHPLETLQMVHGKDMVDEPYELALKMVNKPAYERAECQKCHARYDESTMNSQILKPLKYMAKMNLGQRRLQGYGPPDSTTRQKCVELAKYAEQYLYPANYVYIIADLNLLSEFLGTILTEGRLSVEILMWVQRNARRMLARIEGEGFHQIDFSGMHKMAGFYSLHLNVLQHESRALARIKAHPAISKNFVALQKQITELVGKVAAAAMKKVKPLLVHK